MQQQLIEKLSPKDRSRSISIVKHKQSQNYCTYSNMKRKSNESTKFKDFQLKSVLSILAKMEYGKDKKPVKSPLKTIEVLHQNRQTESKPEK